MNNLPTETMSSSPSHSEVQALLSGSSHDPSIIPQLEAYVRSQVSAVASTLVDCPYSFDANRTLVKLYTFYPNLAGNGGSILSLVSFLSLLQFPNTDLMALNCMIPEHVVHSEPVATIVRCAELLESCSFAAFWPEFRKLGIPEYGLADGQGVSDDRRMLADAINGVSAGNAIRTNIVRILARTYGKAPLGVVLGALDVKDGEAVLEFGSKVTSGEGDETPLVEGVDGEFVTFASTADNTKRVGSAFKDNVSYDQVAGMMAKSTALRGQ